LRGRRTRIVATISPTTVRTQRDIGGDVPITTSDTAAALRSLSEAGVDVFRLNMSFRDDAFVEQVLQWFREEESGEAANAALLGDLQGPKLRLGDFAEQDDRVTPGAAGGSLRLSGGDVRLERGQEFLLYYRPDRAAGVRKETPGDARMGTVLLNDEFYEDFGACLSRGLASGPVEIAVGDGNALLRLSDRRGIGRTCVSTIVEVGGLVGC